MPRPARNLKSPVFAGFLALVLAGATAAPSAAGEQDPPGEYPTWQEVEIAGRNQSAKEAEIASVTALLDGLQSRSEDLGNTAVTSAVDYAVSQSALDDATSRLELITAKSAAASAELARYKKDIGTLAAESYKTGGTNMGIFVAMEAVRTDSMHGLNVVQQVGRKTAALVEKAATAEKAVRAQAGQEQVATAERERLAAEAASRLAAARNAHNEVTSHLEEQQKRSGELIAQLAALKGTTAAAEAAFRQDQAAASAYQAAQVAKRAAAEEQVSRPAAAPARSPRPAPMAAPADPAPGSRPAPAVASPVPAPAPAAAPAPAPAPAPDLAPVPAPAPPVAPAPAPPVVPVLPGGAVNDPAGAKAYASSKLGSFGWGQDQFPCLVQLWTKESNWLTTATNPYSGAYGIAQSLPAGKYSSAGSDWLTNYRTQVNWGLSYIQSRYGSPCSAWAHSVAVNWY